MIQAAWSAAIDPRHGAVFVCCMSNNGDIQQRMCSPDRLHSSLLCIMFSIAMMPSIGSAGAYHTAWLLMLLHRCRASRQVCRACLVPALQLLSQPLHT